MKRAIALFLFVMTVISILPTGVIAANGGENPPFLQIDNGYLTIKVSKAIGGFLIDTAEGDKLS